MAARRTPIDLITWHNEHLSPAAAAQRNTKLIQNFRGKGTDVMDKSTCTPKCKPQIKIPTSHKAARKINEIPED